MNITALFAGIGGLEFGLEKAGHVTSMTCEIWDPAIAVLNARFGGIPNERDVTKLVDLPGDTELLTAGFPCQDLSQAGLTAGITGKRSGLVDHVFRLIDKTRVETVILENVSFMLSLDRGAAMDRLTRAFEERGYRWAYRTINSLAFVPQRRERIFFVASCGHVDPENVLLSDEVVPPNPETRLDRHAHGFYWTEGTRGLGWAPDAIPTLKNGSTIGIPSPPAVLMPTGTVIKPDIRDAERLQGFSAGWTAVAPERSRWSLVGNAVTVPVAKWLGERLLRPGRYDHLRDKVWTRHSRFPRSARFDGQRRHAVEIGSFPAWVDRPPLHEFLRFPGTPLSVRATAGFLSRAEASSLRFVPGFLDAVRSHLEKMEQKLPERVPFRISAEPLVAAE
jgi:DNA (cytosine-5)-methyltransferase 1